MVQPATVSAVAGAPGCKREEQRERLLHCRWMRVAYCSSYLTAASGQDFGKGHTASTNGYCLRNA